MNNLNGYQQLVLAIGTQTQNTFSYFYAGPNSSLCRGLEEWLNKPRQEFCYYIWGKAGSGRTHLLQACCHAAQEQGLSTIYIPLKQYAQLHVSIFDGLEQLQFIAIDDIDTIAGVEQWEESLLYLYERLKVQPARLLVSSDQPPTHLRYRLADLTSRFSLSLVFHLKALDDEDMVAAMQLRARQQGWKLNKEVASFLVHRAPRDPHTVFALVDQLSEVSLQQQRRLTIPFVKSVLSL